MKSHYGHHLPTLWALGRQRSEHNTTWFLSDIRFRLRELSSLFSLLNSAGLTFGLVCIPFPTGHGELWTQERRDCQGSSGEAKGGCRPALPSPGQSGPRSQLLVQGNSAFVLAYTPKKKKWMIPVIFKMPTGRGKIKCTDNKFLFLIKIWYYYLWYWTL